MEMLVGLILGAKVRGNESSSYRRLEFLENNKLAVLTLKLESQTIVVSQSAHLTSRHTVALGRYVHQPFRSVSRCIRLRDDVGTRDQSMTSSGRRDDVCALQTVCL